VHQAVTAATTTVLELSLQLQDPSAPFLAHSRAPQHQ
jgi:hypothetical protein